MQREWFHYIAVRLHKQVLSRSSRGMWVDENSRQDNFPKYINMQPYSTSSTSIINTSLNLLTYSPNSVFILIFWFGGSEVL